jgi:hypothetical protein
MLKGPPARSAARIPYRRQTSQHVSALSTSTAASWLVLSKAHARVAPSDPTDAPSLGQGQVRHKLHRPGVLPLRLPQPPRLLASTHPTRGGPSRFWPGSLRRAWAHASAPRSIRGRVKLGTLFRHRADVTAGRQPPAATVRRVFTLSCRRPHRVPPCASRSPIRPPGGLL